MSDANRVRLSYVQEVTWGTTPASNLTDLRYTGESLEQNTTTEESKEIQATRNIADVIRTSVKAQGAINVELIEAAHNDLILGALCSAGWSSPTTIGPATTISAAAADNSFNDSANGFGSLVVGQWVKVSGFATANNNGFFKILTKTAGKITVVGNAALTNEAAGPSVSIIMGAQATNGVAQPSFTIERNYTDLSNIFATYRGMAVDQMSLRFAAEQIVTGSFTFLGKAEEARTSSAGTGYVGSPAGATNDVIQCVDNIPVIMEGSTYAAASLVELTAQCNNNMGPRPQIGTLGPISLRWGNFNCSGSLRAYFSTAALFTKYLAFTASGLVIITQDAAGNAMLFEWPRVKFTTGKRVAGGVNTDIIADLTWMAMKHPTEGITMRVTKW